MRDIRLLQLLKSLDIGGIQTTNIRLLNELSNSLGFSSIFSGRGSYLKSGLIDKKVKVFSTHIRLNAITIMFMTIKIICIINKYQINTVHYHHRLFLPIIIFIKIFMPNIRIVYTHHNVFNDYLTKLIEADYYVAISQATRNELVQHGKKCTLVNHGVILPLEKQIKPNKKIKRIGYVGRFTQSKGLDTLLTAFKLISEINDELDLVMWGEGKLKNEILTFIKVNNIADRVKLYPPSTELNNIYSSFDCLVVPSESLEGFGLVIIEAMSYGIPVVVSDLPVFLETVENYKNGLIFKRGDYKDLSEKIIELTENNTLKDSLTENALQIIKKRYNFESTVVKHIKIFNK